MPVSDDELVIRHVRLCDCGLPAGHDRICRPARVPAGLGPDDVQPIDADIEEIYARRRAERHAKRQPAFREQRVLARSRMTNQQLSALAAVRAAQLSPIPAGNIEPSHGAGGHPSTNLALRARSVDLRADPRWRVSDDAERRALVRKHELLDELEGHGTATADRELTPEDKDTAIVAAENAHLTAVEFARQHPGFGAPSTIARKRRWHAAGLCTFSGLSPRPDCRCPTCRNMIA